MADRTTYAKRNGLGVLTDAAGYNMVAFLSGVVALGALAFVVWARPRVLLMVLGVAGAVAAFGLTVYMSGIAVWARFQGEVWFYGTGSYAADAADMGRRRVTLDPADDPYFFAAVALVGAIASVAFGIMRLRQPVDARPDARGQARIAPFEDIVRWVALGCAIFLLFGPLGGRTMLVDGKTTITDSAVYNIVAVLSGIVAIAGLAIADRARPRAILVALGAAIAIAAFGFTAYVAGMFSLPLFRGEVMVDGGSIITDSIEVHPAYGPPFFALAALFGAGSTAVFAIHRLRQIPGAS